MNGLKAKISFLIQFKVNFRLTKTYFKIKKKMRQTVWKKQVEKQALKSLFLAKYLIKNSPEDPAIEKLVTRITDTKNSEKLD